MNEKYPIVSLYGIRFNLANDLSILLAAVLVFVLVFALSRHPKIRPSGKQNVLEWMIDFTNGIVRSSMPGDEGRQFYLFAFVMFLFIFMSNQMGLFIQIIVGGTTYIKSPTTDPVVTMSLAMIVLLMSHYFGVKKWGFKGYIGNYFRPVAFLSPINVLEEFTNFMTLSLRLYGNIFAGEVLLNIINELAQSHGVLTWIPALPLEMIWQGFSVFIGSIQAYVFVILGTVYISRKLERD